MGGEGSGRRPNPENIARSFLPQYPPGVQPQSEIAQGLYLPNNSAIKDEAKKSSSGTLTTKEYVDASIVSAIAALPAPSFCITFSFAASTVFNIVTTLNLKLGEVQTG